MIRMRGEQMARQWRLLKQLEASGVGITAKEISDNAEVSLRTAYRDLEDLQNSGFPLYVENTENEADGAHAENLKGTRIFTDEHGFLFT